VNTVSTKTFNAEAVWSLKCRYSQVSKFISIIAQMFGVHDCPL